MVCSASVNALQIVISNGSYESTAKWEIVRYSERTVCWCQCSWSVCNENSHFIRCIQSSSCHG